MQWQTKIWRTGWKVALAGLAAVLLLEALLTFFPGVFFPDKFFVYDPDLGFRVKAYGRYDLVLRQGLTLSVIGLGLGLLFGQDQTQSADAANEFGFNDRDYPLQAAPGVYRILVVSDSFNWADGPHGNYTNLLEEEFAKSLGRGRVEVICAGYSMTHTVEQLAMLKKFGLQYDPDLVVLGFYAGNDFFDADPHRRRIGFGGTFVDYDTEDDWFFEVLGRPVVFQSRFFAFLNEKWVLYRSRRRIHRERQAARKGEPSTQVESKEEDGSREGQLGGQRVQGNGQGTSAQQAGKQPAGADTGRPPPSMSRGEYVSLIRSRAAFAHAEEAAKFDPNVEYIFGALSEMKRSLDERGIPLVVSAYPAEWQVDQGLQQEVLAKYGFSPSDFQWTRAQRLLADFCRQKGLEFHDLTPAVAAAQRQGEVLYYRNDTHWNYFGNRLAAMELFKVLRPRAAARLAAAEPEGTALHQ